MVLIAIALGVWWGWLVEPIRLAVSCRTVCRILAGLALAAVAVTFAHAVYSHSAGNWTSWTVRLFAFVTAPPQLWPIVGFLAGWLGYARRRQLSDLINPAAPRQPRKSPQDEQPDKSAGGGLLGKIVGLPLLGVLVIVALLFFIGPELRSRLELLKFGDVEARFVAAAQKSLQTTFTAFAPNAPISESNSESKSQLEIDRLLQEEIMKRLGTAANDRVAIQADHERVMKFHADIIFPFADAISCYLKTFAQQDTDLRRRATRLALAWKEFSIKATGAPWPARDLEFSSHIAETFALAQNYAESASGSPSCTPPQLQQAPSGDRFKDDLPALFANASVIAFVANLIASTHDYEQAVEYFNRMASVVDRRPTGRHGQMHFYLKRAAAKDYARWYPRDARSDLRHARGIAEELIGIVTPSVGIDRRLLLYLEKERAGVLNTEIFSTVRDWHEGYRLTRDEIDALEASAAELQKWSRQHSARALGEDPDEVIVAPTVHLIAVAHDTLAVAEIALGESKGDRSKDRCARILDHLAKSKDLFQWWSQVRIKRGRANESNYRSHFRTIDVHYQLYASVCNA
jgi:hypothetical protein